MSAISVNVHLYIRDASVQHGGEILIRPNGVAAISSAGAGDKGRRSIARNRRRRSASKRRGTGVNDAYEIRPRGNSRQRVTGVAVLFVEVFKKNRRRRGQLRPG